MPKQVTLNLKALETAVKDLEAIKAEISSHAGTQAQRMAAAKAEALKSGVKVSVPKRPESLDHDSVVEWAQSILSVASQALDEATTAILRKSKDSATDSLAGLREAFKVKAEAAQAMKNVLVGVGIEGAEAVAIPTLKGTGKVGQSSAKANAKGQQFYRIIDGERRDSVPSQNKFSSVAWYYGAAITGGEFTSSNEGKGCSSDELAAFLKGKGVDVTAGKPWEYTTPDGFVVGMDVEEAAE